MKLIAFSAERYRRFVNKTSVKLHGSIIAFVGPNEAGKSSLLKALTHLNNTRAWEAGESPRRSNTSPQLTWHLQLEQEDKEAIKDIPGVSQIERVVVTKGEDTKHYWTFKPSSPVRDRSERLHCAQILREFADTYSFTVANDDPAVGFTLDQYRAVIDLLEQDVNNFDQSDISAIAELGRVIQGLDFGGLPEDSPLQLAEATTKFEQIRTETSEALSGVASRESEPSPVRRAIDALVKRVPEIMYFSEADRNLSSQYDLTEVAKKPPKALEHLAALAKLDLPALAQEASEGRVADVGTRRNAANRILLDIFDESWNQQGIAVQVEVQGTILHIQATTPEDAGLSDISERSDGMRWFAALLAYAHGWTSKPILLVDEIETHLHYDAQADVIAVLAKQSFTSKVIYTTHSFGCLPYDLGTGVRVVQPIDSATSRLETGFWKSGAGFTPLLVSMGAAAMSFTPTRYALLAEGPSDSILIPSLLRQATGVDQLGFHVAPGVSGVAALAVDQLDAEAGRVGFIVDGDEGGVAHANKLIEGGISEDRIIILRDDDGEPMETEDLISTEIYAKAVMEELRLWNPLDGTIDPDDLPTRLRTKYVAEWCGQRSIAAPDKTAVAQRVVDMGSDQTVYEPEQLSRLQGLADQLAAILRLPSPH